MNEFNAADGTHTLMQVFQPLAWSVRFSDIIARQALRNRSPLNKAGRKRVDQQLVTSLNGRLQRNPNALRKGGETASRQS